MDVIVADIISRHSRIISGSVASVSSLETDYALSNLHVLPPLLFYFRRGYVLWETKFSLPLANRFVTTRTGL